MPDSSERHEFVVTLVFDVREVATVLDALDAIRISAPIGDVRMKSATVQRLIDGDEKQELA